MVPKFLAQCSFYELEIFTKKGMFKLWLKRFSNVDHLLEDGDVLLYSGIHFQAHELSSGLSFLILWNEVLKNGISKFF